MEKWLIFGANGQLGKEWISFLPKKKTEFRGLSHQHVDITQESSLRQALESYRPDVVVNCAAYTRVDQAEEEAEKAFRVNAHAVEMLGRWCAAHHVALIHYSTDYVFSGHADDRKKHPGGYPESFPPSPLNVYGMSKLKGEEALLNHCPEALILRVSWLCSLHSRCFLTTMLELGETKSEIQVVDDQVSAPTFTHTAVNHAYELLLQGKRGRAHLACSGETSWYGFAKEIFKITGKSVHVVPVSSEAYPAKAKRPQWSRLDISGLDAYGLTVKAWQDELREVLSKKS
ncbi:dTDP-4-dehydrorhamnose reductase [Balneolaceae bacterium ANBcel3]|nr:dTDP-4-dehydrorhamnose reductase [Balneolaceae bacterium ANBcel3]